MRGRTALVTAATFVLAACGTAASPTTIGRTAIARRFLAGGKPPCDRIGSVAPANGSRTTG